MSGWEPELSPAPAADPAALRPARTWLHLLLFVATFLTTTIAGAYMAHFDADWVRLWGLLKLRPDLAAQWFVEGLSFSVPLMAILAAHELGHYLVARHHGVDTSLPYFLPGPNLLGTFGAVIVMRSRIPHRRALFDIGAAGPLAGLIVAGAALVLGLLTARMAPFDALAPAASLPQGGVMFGPNLLIIIVGNLLHAVPDGVMLVSPLLDAACVGFLVTAINLIPVGQLDGGHVACAVFGRHCFWVAIAALAILCAAGVFWLTWIFLAGFLLLLMGVKRLRHPPPENPDLPLGIARAVLALAILIIFILIVAPVPVELIVPE
jgi:membrane-associated protease RseP (regulator of RpoE activity)